jgi:metallo-beta-lactamase class B
MFCQDERFRRLNELKRTPWVGKLPPYRVVGNVYFVGTYQASCHLIDTGDGLILIDTGYASSAYLVLESIYRLHFRPQDVRYIVNTHWHGDHTEATPAFADLSGATTLLGREDAEKAAYYFTPDRLIDDGDTLSLGNTTLRFLHTPGHTKGTISYFFDTEEDGRTLRVGSFGGAGLNTLQAGKFDFPGCREAYFASLARLKQEPVDVFIGNHVWNNDACAKAALLLETGENRFVDPSLWGRFLDNYKERLERIIAREA